jgi:plasmid maintenance system antidote protein VapI
MAYSKTIWFALRQAIEKDGRPLRRIAQAARLSTSTVTRFVNGQRSCSLRVVERIMYVIDASVEISVEAKDGTQAR